MVWRYHPETRAYEIFAEGSGNIFGLEVDAQGRLFSGHNGGETRGWHYVQGGYYLKQGVDPGKFGPPRNPYAFGELPMMRSETRAARFTHLFAVGEGTALPSRYAGMLFALDPLHNVVIAAERRPLGATFSTSDEGPALSSSDVAFRPVHIANAPDGSLFIADFYNYYIAHGQHYQSMIDPDTGRIYRLRGSENALEPDTNLEGKTTGQLIALLSHPNKWHRHMAVRLLGERKDEAATPLLKELLSRETGLAALNAFWALDQSGALDEETALEALAHSCPAVRMWAARWAGDRWGTHPGLGLPGIDTRTGAVPSRFFEALLEQGRHEPDAEVRSQMAASARRFPAEQGLALVGRLFEHESDLHDPYIPLLCWWVLESHSTVHREEVLAVFHDRSLWDRPLVFEHILPRVMRRFALEGRQQDLLACAQLLRMAPSPRHADRLMNGFEEAYRGRAMINLPEELVAAMKATGQLPLIIRVRLREAAALVEALKIIQDPKAGMDDRLLYTRALGELREQAGLPVLLRLAEEDQPVPLRRAALASLSGYEDERIGAELLELLGGLPKELRHAAFAVLAARPQWSGMLLAQIEAGQIQPAALPPDVVDRMRSHRDEALSGLVLKWFPSAASAETGALNEQIKEVQAVLRRGAGSPYAGEAIYMDRCAACHKLFHKGGNLGPDLTAYQRDNIETMLLSIIHPNAEIREGYDYYLIETHDERSLSGFLVQRDPQVTVLRGMEGEDMILRREEIKEIRPLGRSFMPEGLLDELDEQQLRDLFAYLRISQPITR
jgi:putative heme-binding domain-containing protein